MSQDRPDVLTRSIQTTDLWLKELKDDLQLQTPSQAYSVLRPVLHVLRDRLTVQQSEHLAAQFPAMVAGIYYDGWDPDAVPMKIRDADAFLEEVLERAAPGALPADPRRAVGAVFKLLERRLAPGAFAKAADQLPQSLRELAAEA